MFGALMAVVSFLTGMFLSKSDKKEIMDKLDVIDRKLDIIMDLLRKIRDTLRSGMDQNPGRLSKSWKSMIKD